MIGSLLAGTDEAPGEVFLYQGRSYKSYRGMGSIGAMARGSADRYFQQDIKDQLKLVPEGVEGMRRLQGPGRQGGAPAGRRRAAPAWATPAARDIAALQANARFRRVTGAGLRESHVHDVSIDPRGAELPAGLGMSATALCHRRTVIAPTVIARSVAPKQSPARLVTRFPGGDCFGAPLLAMTGGDRR